MTDPFAGRDVAEIWRAVERVARNSGEVFTEPEREAVTWLRNTLGTPKPLESYASRTRRRYRAASKSGKTARETNQSEYRQRKEKGKPTSPTKGGGRENRRQRMRRLIDRRNQLLPQSPVDVDDVDEYVLAFGYDNVLSLLTEQIDSCEWYLRADHRPGNKRWFARKWTDPQRVRPDFTSYIANTDIMYYYHARR